MTGTIPGNLLRTAMGVMPHTDIARALEPDWDFLFNSDLDVLSLDVCIKGEVFLYYARSIPKFFDRRGLIVWKIVAATGFEAKRYLT